MDFLRWINFFPYLLTFFSVLPMFIMFKVMLPPNFYEFTRMLSALSFPNLSPWDDTSKDSWDFLDRRYNSLAPDQQPSLMFMRS